MSIIIFDPSLPPYKDQIGREIDIESPDQSIVILDDINADRISIYAKNIFLFSTLRTHNSDLRAEYIFVFSKILRNRTMYMHTTKNLFERGSLEALNIAKQILGESGAFTPIFERIASDFDKRILFSIELQN